MALIHKGLSWTWAAFAGLVGFLFGLVGAAPPAWAEPEPFQIAKDHKKAEPAAGVKGNTGGLKLGGQLSGKYENELNVEGGDPRYYKMQPPPPEKGEVIPKLDGAGDSPRKTFPKFGDKPGTDAGEGSLKVKDIGKWDNDTSMKMRKIMQPAMDKASSSPGFPKLDGAGEGTGPADIKIDIRPQEIPKLEGPGIQRGEAYKKVEAAVDDPDVREGKGRKPPPNLGEIIPKVETE